MDDVFSHFSDGLSCGSSEMSTSESCGGRGGRWGNLSDEEVLLAARNPKKRAGRKKFKETRHPVYRGVRRRNSDKWVCEVREPNKKTRLWLGTFPTADMAARAHDVAAIALRGRSTCLNFADSARILPLPETAEAKDIRKAAVEAAERFRPIESSDGVSVENMNPENEALAEAEAAAAPENALFMDEEAMFCPPGFLVSMAEAMLLPPPRYTGEGSTGDDMEFCADVSLWSHSI